MKKREPYYERQAKAHSEAIAGFVFMALFILLVILELFR